jgi:hypothetical protein
MSESERLAEKALLSMHEPIMPLYFDDNERLPIGTLGPYIKKPFKSNNSTEHDTIIVLPAQDIGTKAEGELVRFLGSEKDNIEWINTKRHSISGIGSLQLNIKFKEKTNNSNSVIGGLSF